MRTSRPFTSNLAEKVKSQDLITVYLNAEVVRSSGFLGNFVSEIKTPDGETSVPHGAAVVATGGYAYKPEEYLFGEHDRVLTSLEMDDLIAKDPKTDSGREVRGVHPVRGVQGTGPALLFQDLLHPFGGKRHEDQGTESGGVRLYPVPGRPDLWIPGDPV